MWCKPFSFEIHMKFLSRAFKMFQMRFRHPSASEQIGSNLTELKDFCLKAKAIIWPWLSYMCHIHSPAVIWCQALARETECFYYGSKPLGPPCRQGRASVCDCARQILFDFIRFESSLVRSEVVACACEQEYFGRPGDKEKGAPPYTKTSKPLTLYPEPWTNSKPYTLNPKP